MSDTVSLLLLGTGAGDANFGTPPAEGLPEKDVRRHISNYLAPDILIDFNHQTIDALNTFGVDAKKIRHLLISHGHYDHRRHHERWEHDRHRDRYVGHEEPEKRDRHDSDRDRKRRREWHS